MAFRLQRRLRSRRGFRAVERDLADQGCLRAATRGVDTGRRLNLAAFEAGHAEAPETGYVVPVLGPGARYLRLRLAERALLTGRGRYQLREGTAAGRRPCGCHPASSSISDPGSARSE